MSRISKHEVHLTDEEREAVRAFVSCGQRMAREITRARILLLALTAARKTARSWDCWAFRAPRCP
jgi:hypothetical protein